MNETKLHPPTFDSRRLVGAALLDTLTDAVHQHPLTLVLAPAGYGKTTLLAQFALREPGRQVGWLSVGPDDNDPQRLWPGLTEATRRAGVGVAPSLAAADLHGPRTHIAVSGLLNAVEAAEHPVLVVLDDFHLLTDERILDQFDLVLAHHPSNLRLVIASRSEPRLRLERLHAHGSLHQLDASDLALDVRQTAQLVNEIHGLGLDEDAIAELHARTEGWPAGINLAVASLRRRGSSVLRRPGSERPWTTQYLWREVVEQHPVDIQQFLVQTSVLDVLSASVCEALTGRSDAGTVLDGLVRDNTFVVAVGVDQRWYRYHHLLHDALRAHLARLPGEQRRELHRRASRWHAHDGDLTTAIRHAVAAEDVVLLGSILDRRPDRHAFFDGRLFSEQLRDLASAWLRHLEPDTTVHDARVCLLAAWISLSAGDAHRAHRWLSVATSLVDADDQDERLAPTGELALAWMVHHQFVGDLSAADEAGHRGLAALPASSPLAGMVRVGLGMNRHWFGDLAAAAELLESTLGAFEPGRDDLPRLLALGHLAELNRVAGRRAEAEGFAERALELAAAAGLADHYASALAWASSGALLTELRRFDEADARLCRAVRAARQSNEPPTVSHALVRLAAQRVAAGAGEESLRFLRAARDEAMRCPDPRTRDAILGRVDAELGHEDRQLTDVLCEPARLTRRELMVLRMLSGSLSQPEIARELGVSTNTVKTHVKAVYAKLGVTCREDAVARGQEQRGLASVRERTA